MTSNNERRPYRGLLWPFLLLVQAGLLLKRQQGVLKQVLFSYSHGTSIDKVEPLRTGNISFPRTVLFNSNSTAPRARVIRQTNSSLMDELWIETQTEEESSGDNQCISKEWQTTFHPNCNELHSFSMGDNLVLAASNHEPSGLFHLFGNGGNRLAGKCKIHHDTTVYKTGRFHLQYMKETFEFSRKEAVAMEMLKGATTDIYSYCGLSSVTQLADGGTMHRFKHTNEYTPPNKMLQYAISLAKAVAQMHSIDDDYVTLVHRDLGTSNIVFVGDEPKIIDFHTALLIKWNTTGNRPCFPFKHASITRLDFLPPEMARDDIHTEKIDVYSLGGLFFYMLSHGARPFHCERPQGVCNYEADENTISDKALKKMKFNGTLPQLPTDIEQSKDPAIAAIRSAMNTALHGDPRKRPSAREIYIKLERVQQSLVGDTGDDYAFHVDDLVMSDKIPCGKDKCFFRSKSNDRLGYLIARPKPNSDLKFRLDSAWHLAQELERDLHIRHFMKGPVTKLAITKDVASVINSKSLWRESRRHYYNQDDKFFPEGATAFVQPCEVAPEPILFNGKGSKRRTFISQIDKFVANVTDKASFEREFKQSISITQQMVEREPCLCHDFQLILDARGRIHQIDFDRCWGFLNVTFGPVVKHQVAPEFMGKCLLVIHDMKGRIMRALRLSTNS